MSFSNRSKYEKKLAKLKRKNEIAKQKNELIEEKNKYKKKTTTSKWLLLVVILLCVEILVFSQYVMIKFQDLTALYTLIGVPVTIVPVVLGYYYKSKAENTVGGVTYEAAVHQMEMENQVQGIEGTGGVANAGAEYVDINNYAENREV